MSQMPPMDGCRSFFASGDITSETYTRVWINLINQMEKRKSVSYLEDIIIGEMDSPAKGAWDRE